MANKFNRVFGEDALRGAPASVKKEWMSLYEAGVSPEEIRARYMERGRKELAVVNQELDAAAHEMPAVKEPAPTEKVPIAAETVAPVEVKPIAAEAAPTIVETENSASDLEAAEMVAMAERNAALQADDAVVKAGVTYKDIASEQDQQTRREMLKNEAAKANEAEVASLLNGETPETVAARYDAEIQKLEGEIGQMSQSGDVAHLEEAQLDLVSMQRKRQILENVMQAGAGDETRDVEEPVVEGGGNDGGEERDDVVEVLPEEDPVNTVAEVLPEEDPVNTVAEVLPEGGLADQAASGYLDDSVASGWKWRTGGNVPEPLQPVGPTVGEARPEEPQLPIAQEEEQRDYEVIPIDIARVKQIQGYMKSGQALIDEYKRRIEQLDPDNANRARFEEALADQEQQMARWQKQLDELTRGRPVEEVLEEYAKLDQELAAYDENRRQKREANEKLKKSFFERLKTKSGFNSFARRVKAAVLTVVVAGSLYMTARGLVAPANAVDVESTSVTEMDARSDEGLVPVSLTEDQHRTEAAQEAEQNAAYLETAETLLQKYEAKNGEASSLSAEKVAENLQKYVELTGFSLEDVKERFEVADNGVFFCYDEYNGYGDLSRKSTKQAFATMKGLEYYQANDVDGFSHFVQDVMAQQPEVLASYASFFRSAVESAGLEGIDWSAGSGALEVSRQIDEVISNGENGAEVQMALLEAMKTLLNSDDMTIYFFNMNGTVRTPYMVVAENADPSGHILKLDQKTRDNEAYCAFVYKTNDGNGGYITESMDVAGKCIQPNGHQMKRETPPAKTMTEEKSTPDEEVVQESEPEEEKKIVEEVPEEEEQQEEEKKEEDKDEDEEDDEEEKKEDEEKQEEDKDDDKPDDDERNDDEPPEPPKPPVEPPVKPPVEPPVEPQEVVAPKDEANEQLVVQQGGQTNPVEQTTDLEAEGNRFTEAPAVVPEANAEVKQEGMVADQTATEEEQQQAHAEQQAANEQEIQPSATGENTALDDQAYEDYIDSLLDQLGDSDIG